MWIYVICLDSLIRSRKKVFYRPIKFIYTKIKNKQINRNVLSQLSWFQSLLSTKSAKQMETTKLNEEIMELLSKPSAKVIRKIMIELDHQNNADEPKVNADVWGPIINWDFFCVCNNLACFWVPMKIEVENSTSLHVGELFNLQSVQYFFNW